MDWRTWLECSGYAASSTHPGGSSIGSLCRSGRDFDDRAVCVAARRSTPRYPNCCKGVVMRGLSVALVAFIVCSSVAFGQIPAQQQTLYRFDAQSPWLHGFHSYRSPFAGHASFRPSNFRQVDARAQFMQSYTSEFWLSYSERPSAVDMSRFRSATPILKPSTASNTPSQPTLVEDGAMSPIRSIRIVQPRALPVPTKLTSGPKSPPVVRALQRNESGPLFPLP